MYRYVADPDLKAPRRWFTANVDQILDVYGSEHLIQKEDLMLGKQAQVSFMSAIAERV